MKTIRHLSALTSFTSIALVLAACGVDSSPKDPEEPTGSAEDALQCASWVIADPNGFRTGGDATMVGAVIAKTLGGDDDPDNVFWMGVGALGLSSTTALPVMHHDRFMVWVESPAMMNPTAITMAAGSDGAPIYAMAGGFRDSVTITGQSGGRLGGGPGRIPSWGRVSLTSSVSATDDAYIIVDHANAIGLIHPLANTGKLAYSALADNGHGGLLAAGRFTGTVTCGSTSASTDTQPNAAFIASFTTSGACEWIHAMPFDKKAEVRSLSYDPISKSIAFGGMFFGSLNWGDVNHPLSSTMSSGRQTWDGFYGVLVSGGLPFAVRTFAGSGNESVDQVKFGSDGTFYIAASYNGSDSAFLGQAPLPTNGGTNAVIARAPLSALPFWSAPLLTSATGTVEVKQLDFHLGQLWVGGSLNDDPLYPASVGAPLGCSADQIGAPGFLLVYQTSGSLYSSEGVYCPVTSFNPQIGGPYNYSHGTCLVMPSNNLSTIPASFDWHLL